MKKILILLLCLLVLCGCKSKDDDSTKDLIISKLGVTTDSQVVVKFKNSNKEESYYIILVNGKKYEKYLYTFHKNKKNYEEFIENHSDYIYELDSKEDCLLNVILLKSGVVESDSAKDYFVDKYSNDKTYEILY